jgi:hypothetical protein
VTVSFPSGIVGMKGAGVTSTLGNENGTATAAVHDFQGNQNAPGDVTATSS